MRVALLGAGGQLGNDLMHALADEDLTPLLHADLDITDPHQTRKVLEDLRPETVVNTAAFHQVDQCEEEIERAFDVNAYGVRTLARVCRDLDALLVHISTDYVFDGEKSTPYTEEDPPSPLSVYGVAKVAGEHFVRNIAPRHLVVRSSGLYGIRGASGKGGNFVETMIRMAKESRVLRVVDDQVLSPTFTKDLATKIREAVRAGASGVVHITNSGACSWYEFAGKIFELTGLAPDFGPTTTAEYGLPAPRPAYSVLGNTRLAAIGVAQLRPWHEALAEYLGEKGHLAREGGR